MLLCWPAASRQPARHARREAQPTAFRVRKEEGGGGGAGREGQINVGFIRDKQDWGIGGRWESQITIGAIRDRQAARGEGGGGSDHHWCHLGQVELHAGLPANAS